MTLVRGDAVADAGLDDTISPGDTAWIGNDTAAVGGGAGMPCWWFKMSGGSIGTSAIDSGGRIQVNPDTTTTYVEMMNVCGNITYDTVTVWVWSLATPPQPSPKGREVVITPNPARDVLHIENAALHTKYVIVNLLGQQMDEGEIVDKIINIYNVQAGMYFIELTDEYGNKKTMKFIKM